MPTDRSLGYMKIPLDIDSDAIFSFLTNAQQGVWQKIMRLCYLGYYRSGAPENPQAFCWSISTWRAAEKLGCNRKTLLFVLRVAVDQEWAGHDEDRIWLNYDKAIFWAAHGSYKESHYGSKAAKHAESIKHGANGQANGQANAHESGANAHESGANAHESGANAQKPVSNNSELQANSALENRDIENRASRARARGDASQNRLEVGPGSSSFHSSPKQEDTEEAKQARIEIIKKCRPMIEAIKRGVTKEADGDG